MITIGQRIHELRVAREQTQRDVSYDLMLPVPHLYHIESGQARFPRSWVPRFAQYYHVSEEKLLADVDPASIADNL